MPKESENQSMFENTLDWMPIHVLRLIQVSIFLPFSELFCKKGSRVTVNEHPSRQEGLSAANKSHAFRAIINKCWLMVPRQ